MKKILSFLALILLSFSLAAQSGYEIKGTVVDELGPVIGAAVLEQGTTVGVQTDLMETFRLLFQAQTPSSK